MQFSIDQTQRLVSLRQQIWLFLSVPAVSRLARLRDLRCDTPVDSIEIRGHLQRLWNANSGPDSGDDQGLVVGQMNAVGWRLWLVLAIACAAMIVSSDGIWRLELRLTLVDVDPADRPGFPVRRAGRLVSAIGDFGRIGITFAKSRWRSAGSRASEDQWLTRKCQAVAADIEQGTLPSTAAAMASLPASLGQVFRSASSKRTFVEALRGLAEIFSARCFNSSQLVNSVVAPMAVTMVIGFIGVMVAALFLPLLMLLNALA